MEQRKLAIISGGCGGIGRVIGKRLSEEGFDVVALYFSTPQEKADAMMESFAPGDHEALRCDIRDGEATEALLGDVIKRRGVPDACIHAAIGPILRKALLDMRMAELKDQFEVGVFGGFNFIRPIAAAMKAARKGAIIGMLSRTAIGSQVSYGKMAGYSVAKGGLRALLAEFQKELSGTGIAVNALAPAFIDTPLSDDIPAEVKKFILERAPGNKETAAEVAAAISFLCSPAAEKTAGKIFSPALKEIALL